MKTLIMYYSLSGNTEALAKKKARELDADIERIVEINPPSMIVGIHRAVNRTRARAYYMKGTFEKRVH